MRTRDQDIQAVKALKVGETAYVFWLEEGGGEVLCTPDGYTLNEVPQYGGIPMFYGNFSVGEEEKLVDIARTWT